MINTEMSENEFSLPKKVHSYSAFSSVGFAVRGMIEGMRSEKNILLQVSIGVVSILASLYFNRPVFIIPHLLFMGGVVSIELINTAFEYLCDLVHPQYSEKVKSIKDIAAGAVIFFALCWLILITLQLYLIITNTPLLVN